MAITAEHMRNADLDLPEVAGDVVLVHGANEAPTYAAILAAGLTGEVSNDKFEWASDSLDARRTTVNAGGLDSTSTVINVASTLPFYPGAVVLFEATNEIGHVTSVGVGTVTVIRGIGSGIGGVAAANGSVANGAGVLVVGNSRGEASGVPASRDGLPVKTYNFLQIFKRSIELSGTAQATALQLSQGERERQQAVELENTIRDIEHMLWFGTRGEFVDGAGKRNTMSGGFFRFITTNVDNIGGTATEARMDQAWEMMFSKGSSEKWGIAGGTALRALHTMYKGRYQVRSGENRLGIKITELQTPFGLINLLHNRSFVGPSAQTIGCLDPKALRLVNMATRGLALQKDLQLPGDDKKVDQWFGHLGLRVGAEELHGAIKGLSGAA